MWVNSCSRGSWALFAFLVRRLIRLVLNWRDARTAALSWLCVACLWFTVVTCGRMTRVRFLWRRCLAVNFAWWGFFQCYEGGWVWSKFLEDCIAEGVGEITRISVFVMRIIDPWKALKFISIPLTIRKREQWVREEWRGKRTWVTLPGRCGPSSSLKKCDFCS